MLTSQKLKSGKKSLGGTATPSKGSSALEKHRREKQGPTDWTHLGLKSKHRDERNREEAWRESQRSKDLFGSTLYELHAVVPAVRTERHPVHGLYWQRLESENAACNERTRSRLLMKRYVFDVQELWIANLEHLREHKADHLFPADNSEQPENYQRGHGLENRRDVKEISAMNHQIQAVSQKRAFSNAYHTTRLPQVNIVLDYVPYRTPLIAPLVPLPPKISSVVSQLRLEPNGAGYDLLDGSVCSTVSALCLNVDRLIPSLDYASLLSCEALWRFELLDTASLVYRTFMCSENYAVDLAAASQRRFFERASVENAVLLFSSEQQHTLPSTDGISFWKTVNIQVVCRKLRSNDSMAFQISYEVVVQNIDAIESTPFALELNFTPFEIAHLLYSGDEDDIIRKVPLFSEGWWRSMEGKPLWGRIIPLLAIHCVDGSPQALKIAEERFSNLVGTLTGLQSKSAMHWMLHRLRVAQEGNIRSLVIAGTDGSAVRLADVTEKREAMKSKVVECTRNLFMADMRALSSAAVRAGLWEELLEFSSCLSMFANNLNVLTQQVPGSCEIGRNGLWIRDQLHPHRELTRAAANIFRDTEMSSTESILVNMTLALETSILFKPVTAWESFSQSPVSYPMEKIPSTIPLITQFPCNNQLEALRSPLDQRMPSSIVVFGRLPVEGIDYLPRDVLQRPAGFRRFVPNRNFFGFREQTEETLLALDPHIDLHVYGITRGGAIPNTLGVNCRNIWHNVIATSEHINRPRNAKDYHYIITNSNHCGPNVPTSYTTRMRAHEMVGLTSSVLKQFEDTYEKIKQLRSVFNKQLAMDMKIERIENELKIKEASRRRAIRDEIQRKLEKKLNKATKSEKGWKKRFLSSQLLELQGNWERRKDAHSGLVFFHRVISDPSREKYLDTCQWEVPTEWDGDMWNNPSIDMQMLRERHAYEADPSVSSGKHAPQPKEDEELAAFVEPSAAWIPHIPAPESTPYDQTKSAGIHSTGAERSYEGSSVQTMDTEHIEKIAEQLLQSDQVLRALARRLGISDQQIVPVEDLQSIFSVESSVKEKPLNGPLPAPRDADFENLQESDEDSDEDLWSDDEIVVGDFDAAKELPPLEDLPQNQLEAVRLRRREDNRFGGDKTHDNVSVPDNVPYLDLGNVIGTSNMKIERNQEQFGWRRLPRPKLAGGFLSATLKPQTRGPDSFSCNTINSPVFLVPISPVDACKYTPEEFSIAVESLFVPDAKKDMERAVATLERNIRIEEEIARNMPSDDLFLFGEAKEFTSVDAFLARQYKEDQKAVSDPKEAAKEKAILAAKATNIAQMEDALAEDIPINTADEFGNTLLILSAQQGSKRMCKFLLRRGANINIQNLTGNTALHYCYAYGNRQLGEYLKAKGADDSIVNVDGLTCYEGLNRENMNQTYTDFEESDFMSSQDMS